MSNNNNILDPEVAVPLKYLSKFRKSFDLPLTVKQKLICDG